LKNKMTASSRGSRAAASVLRECPIPILTKRTLLTRNKGSTSSRPRQPICASCSHSQPSRRTYAVAAASLKTLDNTPNSEPPQVKATPPVTASTPHYTTKAGILLTRPPLLTPPLTSFEKAYFFYQKRLNERLALPFTRYFYFKKGTPADTDWKIKARERNGVAARELGGYRAYGEEAWNDELLVNDLEQESGEGEGKSKGKGLGKMGLAEPRHVVDSLVKEARVRAIEGKDGAAVEVQEGDEVHVDTNVDQPLKRWTDADRKRDVRRLDRQLARTLYLLVKREGGGWGFPAGELVGRENLHPVCYMPLLFKMQRWRG
jgi:large subunit ribosomal protein L46